jgi:Spy/CpxP family protein refolding chaperone
LDLLWHCGLGHIQDGRLRKTTITKQQISKQMKTRTFLKYLAAVAGLLCLTSLTNCRSYAQPAGGGGFGGGGFGGRGGALTPEQNQQMRDALPADSADLTALTAKLTAAQKDAIDAALAKDATEVTVRAKVEAVAKIQTDIAMLHYTKAVKPMAASVTDDQKTQIAAAPGMTYNQLFGGGFGGRGGRRGGGGGGGGGGN